MIGNAHSRDDESQVNGALANISLIASKVWAYDRRDDEYRKLNESLWLQNRKLSETREGKCGKATRVRDVIPGSRLARYGNYEYNAERERMYNSTGISRETRKLEEHEESGLARTGTEPWMTRQVEELFSRLGALPTPTVSSPSSKNHRFHGEDDNGKYATIPYTIEDRDESQLRARLSDKSVKDLWDSRRPVGSTSRSQRSSSAATAIWKEKISSRMRRRDNDNRSDTRKHFSQSSHCAGNVRSFKAERPTSLLYPVSTISSTRSKPIVPVLCPEVAEFFPKGAEIVDDDEDNDDDDDDDDDDEDDDDDDDVGDDDVGDDGDNDDDDEDEDEDEEEDEDDGEEDDEDDGEDDEDGDDDDNDDNAHHHHHHHEEPRGSVRFFPSTVEASYKDELFPYNRAHSSTLAHNSGGGGGGLAIAVSHPASATAWIRGPPHQWIHRIGPPVRIQVPGIGATTHPPIYSTIQPFCPTIVHRPINVGEKIIGPGQVAGANTAPIPVYQRPAELYQENCQRRPKNNNQGVDFNNLILLTKNAMKARRNQSKNPRRASSFILESRQPNLKSESDVLRWLNRGYPKRAREFGTVNRLVSELTRFEGECDSAQRGARRAAADVRRNWDDRSFKEETSENDSVDEVLDDLVDRSNAPPIVAAKKRLYRDVLTNAASSDVPVLAESLIDERYDELEKQAMEQYRTSEECLAVRYQELERQGLEEYRYGDGSSESIRAIRSSTLCPGRGRTSRDSEAAESSEKSCGDNGTGSAGLANVASCNFSPGKDAPSSEADKAGPAMERPITIPRSDIKCATIASNIGQQASSGGSRGNGSVVATRATGLPTKSLTSLNEASIEIASKRPIDGASGDKIGEQVRSSINDGGATVPPTRVKTTMTSVRNDPGVSGRRIAAIRGSDADADAGNVGIASGGGGGGDEKTAIVRSSPRARVWLSSFWR